MTKQTFDLIMFTAFFGSILLAIYTNSLPESDRKDGLTNMKRDNNDICTKPRIIYCYIYSNNRNSANNSLWNQQDME